MTRIAIFGATGSLGSHVARLAVAAGHDVSALVRVPAKLPPDIASKATITTGDLMQQQPSQLGAFISGHDVLISCRLVTEGQRFIDLFDRVVSSRDIAENRRPLCWLLAGAGLLDLDSPGRRGLDLPKVRDTYWPHRANFERLQRSTIEWRLLCPGPMVDQPAVGIHRLRVSLERLPVAMPAVAKLLPDPLVLPLFATSIPQMIIPYADAAAFMLANLARGGPMSRKRVGLALPRGMTGRKDASIASWLADESSVGGEETPAASAAMRSPTPRPQERYRSCSCRTSAGATRERGSLRGLGCTQEHEDLGHDSRNIVSSTSTSRSWPC
jgi:putative NADH-flavin reductase